MPLIGWYHFDSLTLLFWFDHFLEARAENLTKILLVFLVDLKTPKSHFGINWLLSRKEKTRASTKPESLLAPEVSSAIVPSTTTAAVSVSFACINRCSMGFLMLIKLSPWVTSVWEMFKMTWFPSSLSPLLSLTFAPLCSCPIAILSQKVGTII